MHKVSELDRKYVWHPFTQMRDWMGQEPILIERGKGSILTDVNGKKYLDGNASIWTNLHGHNNFRMNSAIAKQLAKVAHSSALGLANEPASVLAEKLVKAAGSPLKKVFYSDDGSTALEVALKMSYEHNRRINRSKKPRFLSLMRSYHGDTIGAASLGQIDLFRRPYNGLLFKADKVISPYCYRCPFNKAKPERRDARLGRKCKWECVSKLEKKIKSHKYAALVVEPRVQGAAGMIMHPSGWLKRTANVVKVSGAQLIADEVMTGFGRTGFTFACHKEKVIPDFLCLAKGLTGGYLPMAATLTSQDVFDSFLGEYEEMKTFFHGHSYSGNQLGASAALASLGLLNNPRGRLRRKKLEKLLSIELESLWPFAWVGDIRQEGLVAGVELVADWKTRESFPLKAKIGIKVCEVMARKGVLTRPIGNVVPLLPPYSTTDAQLRKMVRVLRESIIEVLGPDKV